jgi:hypothetical protein
MNTMVFHQIEQLVNSLDIHRIRMVMEFLEWEWQGSVPTQSEIYDVAMTLMEDAYELCKKDLVPSYCTTGGLRARCEIVDGEYVFTLTFEVVSVDNDSR